MVEWLKVIAAFFGFGKQIAKNKAKKLEHREEALDAEARKDAVRKNNKADKKEWKGKKKQQKRDKRGRFIKDEGGK